MNQRAVSVLTACVMVILALGLPACTTVPASEATKDEQRADVRDMADEALGQWYAQQPSAQQEVKQSVGYAVFSDVGFKLFIGGGADGKGVAVRNSDQQRYYMKMVAVAPGLGLGAERFRLVFLFSTEDAFNHFVNNGWEAGADAMALFKTQSTDYGGSKSVSILSGITIYQLTDDGAVTGVSVVGAKFYSDSELQ
jgi:lipid-binding SYLF domain-containing protein